MTHGHEQWWGYYLRELGVLGGREAKGENQENCNSIINKYIKKKTMNNKVAINTYLSTIESKN